MLDAATGAIIGSSRYYDYNAAEKTIAIGYTFLAARYWGGTYNRALKKLMLQHAFTYVDAVLFHVGTTNLRSIKALEKMGMYKRYNEPLNRNDTLSFEYIIRKGEPVFGEILTT